MDVHTPTVQLNNRAVQTNTRDTLSRLHLPPEKLVCIKLDHCYTYILENKYVSVQEGIHQT